MQTDDFIKELLSQLKDAYKENVDLNFRLAALTILVIGWFTANENPLRNLCDLAWLGASSPWMAAAGYFTMMYFFGVLQRRSQSICELLERSGAEPALYRRWRISPTMFGMAGFGHLLVFLGIFFFLWNGYLEKNACPANQPAACAARANGSSK